MTPNTVLPPLPTPVANRNMAKLTKTFVYQDGPPPAHCIFQLQPLFTESQLRDYAIAALALRPGGEPSDEQIKAAIRKLTWDAIACEEDMQIARAVLALRPVGGADKPAEYTYASTQATECAGCGERKHTPLRIDEMGGYVCLTCIDNKLGSLLGEFGYPEAEPSTGEREAFEKEMAPILSDNPTWRESADCELAWQAWQASARKQQREACNFCLDQASAARAALAAQAPSPVAPSEPTDTDILSLMLCWAEGNTGDGEQGTDSEHIAEMRALFAKRAAIQPRQAEPPSDDTAAYHRGWHDGNATAKAAAVAEPRQAPSDALTDEEIVGRAKARGIHDGTAAISLVRAILSTQGDRNG